jgi:hypothetical protein
MHLKNEEFGKFREGIQFAADSAGDALGPRLAACLAVAPNRFQLIEEQEDSPMSSKSLLGIVLIVLGVLALAYQGFTYTVPKKAVDVGPLHVTKDEHHTVPLPPILGALALVGGVALLVVDRRET